MVKQAQKVIVLGKKIVCITHLAGLLASAPSRSLRAETQQPTLHLLASTPLPAISGGDFDHFAVDLQRERLYVVSEVYASIEIFDLRSGKHLKSVTGLVKSPRKIVFVPGKNELYVADAGSGACLVFDVNDLQLVTSVPLEAGPDAGVYDPAARVFYVGNGGRAAGSEYSYVSAISVDRDTVGQRVAIPSATLKTLVLDPGSHRLYATMRDKSEVAVVSLATGTLQTVFDDRSLHSGSAMALDASHHRLFVGNRKPGELIVLDTETGKTVAHLPIGETSDDITYDKENRALYITSDDGLDVIRQVDPDHYEQGQHLDTFGGKTSLYVPSLRRFYVVHTKGPRAAVAGLQVFSVAAAR